MRVYLVLAIVTIGGFLSLGAIRFAAGLFLWNDIFRPLFFARNPYAFPIVNIVFAILLGSYILNWVRGKLVPRIHFYVWYIPVYLIWIFISASQSPFQMEAYDGFWEIIKLIGPLVLIASAINTKEDVRFLVMVLTISVGLWSTQSGIYCLIKGPSSELGIPGGQMTDNNDFMAATVSILPALLYFSFGYQGVLKWAVKGAGFSMAFLSLVAIIMSNSRGAAIGLIACLLLFISFVSKKKVLHTVLILGALAVAIPLIPQSFWDRMNTINIGVEQSEGSAVERVHMMKSAFFAIVDNPIFGVGPRCWLLAAPTYSGLSFDPHNIWLKLCAEIGIPGLILYLIMASMTIKGLLLVRKNALLIGDSESAKLAVALIMCILGFIMPSTFLSHPFSEFLWAWFGIGNGFIALYMDGMKKNKYGLARKKVRPNTST
jgi:O-antigen ligase